VHVITRKGFGYPLAEQNDEDCLHQVSPLAVPGAAPKPQPWTRVFGQELTAIGAERPDVVAITAAMLHPTGLNTFAAAYPDRVYDVGIAEQHAVTSAAGLAMGGMHPVVAIYATFLNRAFDQVLTDVAMHRLPVTFVLDRAGVTGPDGSSHHGMWDYSILGVVPGLQVAAPRDAAAVATLLREAVAVNDGPTVLRFNGKLTDTELPAVGKLGRGDILARPVPGTGQDVLLLGAGPMAAVCLAAAALIADQGIGVTVADPRWVIPADDAIAEAASAHRLVVTVEDACVAGGFGDGVARLLREHQVDTPVRTFGLPREFLPHGERGQILELCGLTPQHLAREITAAVARRTPALAHEQGA
jgi:1-deoxy-D-xylulose-5-phosphate synthase